MVKPKRIRTVGDLREALRALDDDYDIMLVDAHGAEADIGLVAFQSDHDGAVIMTDVAFTDPKPKGKKGKKPDYSKLEFAKVVWMVGDITDRTGLSEEAAAEWLETNAHHIQDRLIELGHEVIATLLSTDDIPLKEN